MIAHYEFIDGKPGPGPLTGLKERQLGATTYLYNKLSADETNNIRTKLNELADAANFVSVPLYGEYGLKFKGVDNVDMLTIEPGDIAHRYSAAGIEENARFNGGDPQDPANYTALATFEPIMFISDGLTNEFELPVGMKAGHVFIDRGMRYKITDGYPTGEWDQEDRIVELAGAIIAAGKKVYITP